MRKTSRRRRRGRRCALEPLEGRTLFAAGTPDPAFGTGGVVITDFGGGDEQHRETVNVILPRAGARVLAVGTTRHGAQYPIPNGAAALVSYNADGSFDATFGAGGVASVRPPGYTGFFVSAAALQSDGGIVLLGDGAKEPVPNPNFTLGDRGATLIRVTPQGEIDTTFGDNGAVFLDTATRKHAHLLVQADDKILVTANIEENGIQTSGVVRLHVDGSRDTAFGDDGMAVPNFESNPPLLYFDRPVGLLLRPSGQIVLIGASGSARGIAYFLPDGSADLSADHCHVDPPPPLPYDPYRPPPPPPPPCEHDGVDLVDSGGDMDLEHFALAPDGGYYATANRIENRVDTVAVVKLAPDGTLDTSFGGGDGIAELVVQDSVSVIETGLVVDTDGRLLVSASVHAGGDTATAEDSSDPLVARFLAHGAADTAFGTGGYLRLRTDLEERSGFQDLALTPQGIYAAGSADNRFLVARVEGGTTEPSAVAINHVNGTLTVAGTAGSDTITVRGGIGGYIDVTANGDTHSFNSADVERVSILAGGGDDYVDARELTPIITAGVDHPSPSKARTAMTCSSAHAAATASPAATTTTASPAGTATTGSAATRRNRIDGGLGDDVLLGNGGRDSVGGNVGNDTCIGGDQPDLVTGYDGDDSLDGGGGLDRIDGGAGRDTLSGGGGDDRLYARDGEVDQVTGGRVAFDRAVVDEDDGLAGIEQLL